MLVDGHEIIVGEARYAFEDGSIEFGLSIDDRWQGHGIGKALLKNLECRAASFGADRLFGDTLRSNEAMIGLARKSGYAFSAEPRRLEAGAFRKAYRRRTARHPLRELEARRRLPPSRDGSSRELSMTGPVLAAPEPGCLFTRPLRSSGAGRDRACLRVRRPGRGIDFEAQACARARRLVSRLSGLFPVLPEPPPAPGRATRLRRFCTHRRHVRCAACECQDVTGMTSAGRARDAIG